MQIGTGLPQQDVFALRTLEAQKVSTDGVYRLPHVLASSCQILRELLADRKTTYYGPSPSISGIALSQFAEGLHFSAFHLLLHLPACALWGL